jgi:hypothetical protein
MTGKGRLLQQAPLSCSTVSISLKNNRIPTKSSYFYTKEIFFF